MLSICGNCYNSCKRWKKSALGAFKKAVKFLPSPLKGIPKIIPAPFFVPSDFAQNDVFLPCRCYQSLWIPGGYRVHSNQSGFVRDRVLPRSSPRETHVYIWIRRYWTRAWSGQKDESRDRGETQVSFCYQLTLNLCRMCLWEQSKFHIISTLRLNPSFNLIQVFHAKFIQLKK